MRVVASGVKLVIDFEEVGPDNYTAHIRAGNLNLKVDNMAYQTAVDYILTLRVYENEPKERILEN